MKNLIYFTYLFGVIFSLSCINSLSSDRKLIDNPKQGIPIFNLEDLNKTRNDLNETYILMNDIDAAETKNWDDNKGFMPIGNDTISFKGTFLGNGHVIRNLYINRNQAENDNIGLFGVTNGAIIQNLGLEDSNITGNESVGVLVGENKNSYITSCYSTGNVNGQLSIGGLIGHNEYSNIVSSYSIIHIINETGYYIGGLVGSNTDSDITDCYSSVNIIGQTTIGGLVGWNLNNSSITGCNSKGNITGQDIVGGLIGGNSANSTVASCYSTMNVTGNQYAGGLIGENLNSIITSCYSTGNINGSDNIGGLVGLCHSSSLPISSIHYSYSTGLVNGDGDNVGGFVGYMDSPVTISHNYTTSVITASLSNDNIGGFAGFSSNGNYDSCYWNGDNQTIILNDTGGGDDENITESNTISMKQILTYDDWNFTNTWGISDGTSYPYLLRQVK